MAKKGSKNNPINRTQEKPKSPKEQLESMTPGTVYVGGVFLFPDGKSFKDYKYAVAYTRKLKTPVGE